MKNSLNVITIFGFELPWNLDTALFWLLVAQVALIMFMVIVFAVLIRRVGRRNDNATFVIQQPEEMRTPVEVPAPAVIEEPRVEFPEELQGIWGIEGHDDIRVVIGANTLSVDGVVATGITETETEGEYAFLLGDVEYTVFLKRARKHEEAPAEEVAPAEAAATETPETPAAAEAAVAAETPEVIGEAEAADAEKAEEDDGNLRLINGGDYSYCKLYKWVKEAAPEVEAEPIVITFPDSLRGDWVVEGHESVHVRIEEHTLFIDGIEATDIALDADKPTEYMCKVNGLDYVVAYDTSDESGFRNISGGEFKACALVELVEAEAEPEEEEPVIITFPETLRGDWVVEGHEGVHVAIQEYTARIDGVEAKNIALDDEGNYLLTANELNYVIAYNTSDETPVRTIDGGNFERANLIEYVEPAEEPAEEPVEEAPVEEIAEAPVEEAPAAEPEPEVKLEEPATIVVDYGEEESHESGVLRYDKSFTARYIQSSDEIKDWYTKLKNEMLSYKKVKARMSWKRETFRYGRETVALLAYRGSTLCIFLPLNPADYEDSKYKVEDVSDSPSYADTPCMYRLKNEKRVRLAIELFATVMERLGAVRIERISEDYYLPYEGIVELIDKGLVKRVIKNRSDEAIFAQIAPAGEPAEEAPAAEPVQEPTPEPEPEPTPEPAPEPEPEPEPEPTPEPTPEPEPEAKHGKPALIVPDYGEEESHEGGVLRYDKSFTAKLIQSEDEVKGWYTDIKNELLSYKRVHARMSWKRESYNFGREAFAKMSFRGNTLCLYLPIDPSSLMDSKYKVESVEENASYAETPCLYRIKNLKRAKYAKELIAIVAGFVQTEKIERESVDYYLPYEGLVELINKGLIKRNIKDKSEEAFFDDRKQAEPSPVEQEKAEQELPAAAEEPAVEETAEVTPEETAAVPEETPAEEPADEVAATEEAPAEEPAAEPVDEVAATEEAPAEEPAAEPADEVAATEEAPAEEPAVEETADEVAAAEEAPAEEPAVEETADEAAATEEAPAEEPAEEPAVEETEVEELSPQELEYVRSYEEETGDEDGIEVVGVMFRHRGRKVYWFDPDGKEWKKGEIALYITPDNPPQEVIVVDNAKLSPSKLHLPLKPLCKLNRRPQTDNK